MTDRQTSRFSLFFKRIQGGPIAAIKYVITVTDIDRFSKFFFVGTFSGKLLISTREPGAGLHWGRGALAPPDSLVAPPQIQKLAGKIFI